MAATRIDVETFLSFGFKHPVIDVRSEGEYAHAHVPGATSMPLFDNEERRIVGTAYKQQGKQQAIKIGLKLFGKKMVEMVELVESLFDDPTASTAPKTVIIYCWRGGMRSGGVSWLLDLYGFKVYTIVGGYKAFRGWSLRQLEKDYRLKVLGGYTGSGKTEMLYEMKKQGRIVVDLEDIARHKGSAFGNIPVPQPSQEMFENLLALELRRADERCWQADDGCGVTDDRNGRDGYQITEGREKSGAPDLSPQQSSVGCQPSACIWIEDESMRIGHVNIPALFFKNMRAKPVYFLNIPFEERLKHIVLEYGQADKTDLYNAILRIQKRLGGLETKTAIEFLEKDNIKECFRILLKYYDKYYLKGLHARQNLEELLHKIECETVDPITNVTHIFTAQTKKIYV